MASFATKSCPGCCLFSDSAMRLLEPAVNFLQRSICPFHLPKYGLECLSDQRTLLNVTVHPVHLRSLKYENRPDDRVVNEQR